MWKQLSHLSSVICSAKRERAGTHVHRSVFFRNLCFCHVFRLLNLNKKSNYGETTWNLVGVFFRLRFGKPWRKVLIISTLSLPKSIPLVDAASYHMLYECLAVHLIRRFMTSVLQYNAGSHCGQGWPLYAIYLKCLLCFHLSLFSGAVPLQLQKHKWNVQHGELFVRFAMKYV